MKKNFRYGIRRRYLLMMAVLLILALSVSGLTIALFIRTSMRSAVVESYEFMTEKMGLALDSLYEKTDEVTAECILDDQVQKSLLAAGLSDVEKSSLSKYFAYLDLDDVQEYCYVDNKENIYVWSYSKVTYDDFASSGLADRLGEDYAKTQWIWAPDTLTGSGEEALFVGRYVRSLEYAHEPGMLFFKMEPAFLEQIIDEDEELLENVAVGLMNEKGQLLASRFPENYEMTEEQEQLIHELAEANESGAVHLAEQRSGVMLTYGSTEGNITVFTYVPNQVLTNGLRTLWLFFSGIYILIAIAAVVISFYLTRRLTRPIAAISEAMNRFDGTDFSETIELRTNTELDEIGHSYNGMLETIERQVDEIREQEEALRTAELDTLIAQINPHFLYNTLDNIYMLARINQEETTMQMIQALSRYLHVCLSKGGDMVTVADELDNVRSYLEIRAIRGGVTFTYEIDCRVDAENCRVLKLILQPLVENAIRHGFGDLAEEGRIRIEVGEEGDHLVFTVWNSGTPVAPEMLSRLNALTGMPIDEMQDAFPDREHGYGVVNIVTRLRLKYGDDITFFYTSDGNGTCVTIRVPKEEARDEEEGYESKKK